MKTYRNAERTKKWIRNTFTEMMAEKKDIDKITVTELANRADISKTTFYYHYADIYSVAEEFENELIEQLSQALANFSKSENCKLPNFEYYTRGIIDFLKDNESSYRMVMSAKSPRLFVEKLKTIIVQKINEDVLPLPLSSNIKKQQVQTYFFVSACVDVVAEYFRGGFSVTLDDVTEVILEAVTKLTSN